MLIATNKKVQAESASAESAVTHSEWPIEHRNGYLDISLGSDRWSHSKAQAYGNDCKFYILSILWFDSIVAYYRLAMDIER